MRKKSLSITMDEALWRKIKEIADQNNRSVSNMIEVILTEAIKEK